MTKKYIIAIFLFLFAINSTADTKTEEKIPKKNPTKEQSIEELMAKVRKRIRRYSWDESLFPKDGWKSKGYSVNGNPLLYWTCGDQKDGKNTSLILSAVHGDEITPVYFGFRLVEWLKARPELCKDKYIVIAPLVNPDGFLRYTRGTRSNWNKVDLNRNFSTPDWDKHAHRLWKERYKKRRRYYPGEVAESEPETNFQKWLINKFKVSKIMSIHAPLNILDFDGPKTDINKGFKQAYINSCEALKAKVKEATPKLKLYTFGTFPGSLGNYAGKILGIPTLTVELPTTNHRNAGKYFGELEEGTKLFVEFVLEERSYVAQE